ncbi:MAG: phospholipid carrier-dependent glycosyltransferase, partial [Bowdeniella nasicola]|nr:phospholipid carrier-dependent glycosyltransferase [Bowdeniella nasicola]
MSIETGEPTDGEAANQADGEPASTTEHHICGPRTTTSPSMEPATTATPTHLALTRLPTVASRESFLRSRLRLPHPCPAPFKFWVGLTVITLIAAITRLWRLGHPHELVFDETYYVKDAYSLLHQGYAGAWGEEPNAAFAAGDTSSLEDNAAFVVHPDVGKWLIAIGIRIFGVDSAFGWRIAIAIAGIISVWVLGVIAARLFRSTTVALTAAGLLTLDGIHLVETRIALLDGFVMCFALIGFWALLHDRDSSRSELARIIAADPATLNDPWGPKLWWRPWLVVAGIALGLATGVKWSGIYALAVVGLTAFAWDVAARHAVGVRLWVGAGVFRGGIP